MKCHHCSSPKEGNEKSCIEKVPIFSSLTPEEMARISVQQCTDNIKK